jgi:hypothetical protein
LPARHAGHPQITITPDPGLAAGDVDPPAHLAAGIKI